MRKTNSANTILLLGVALSFICSFFLRNILLGVIVFIVSFGFVMYKQRAAFLASSAASAYKKGQIEKSFMLYEKAIQLEGCPGMVKILYAYRLISEGKINEGAKILGTLSYDTMDDNERLNYNATNALSIWKQGGLHRAIEIYEALFEGAKILGTLSYDTMDDNERLNYNATNALSIWKQGGLHRAIEIYEALLNDKDSILIYETLGYLLICAKNYKKALEFNLKAFEFNNTSERIKCNLATSYYYAGHEKEAVKLYKELIADYANFPEPYYYYAFNNTSERIKCNLATSYYYAGHEKEAVKLYKELIADYANFPEPYYYYALILQGCEKYKGALKYFNMALEKKFSHIYTLTEEDIQCKLKEVGGHIGA